MRTLLLEKISKYQTDDFSVVLNTNRETAGSGLLQRRSLFEIESSGYNIFFFILS